MTTMTKEPPPRARRSLSHVGGAVETSGDPELAAQLAQALDVPMRDDARADGGNVRAPQSELDPPDRAHVHGFHTYPARMHPVTAARLVTSFSPRGGVVLDPFCGSGTVLVEAMIAGRCAIGTDLNPLAVSLARLKTQALARHDLDELIAAARDAAAFADERRTRRAGATHRYGPEDVALFEPHVLLELDGLRAGIERAAQGALHDALSLVLSAILVKSSRQQGDTTAAVLPRRDRRCAS